MESSQEKQEGKMPNRKNLQSGSVAVYSSDQQRHTKRAALKHDHITINMLILHTCISDKPVWQVHRWCEKRKKKVWQIHIIVFVQNGMRVRTRTCMRKTDVQTFTQIHYLITFSLLTSMLLTVLQCSFTFFFPSLIKKKKEKKKSLSG